MPPDPPSWAWLCHAGMPPRSTSGHGPVKCLQGPVPVASEGRKKHVQQLTTIWGNPPTSSATKNAQTFSKCGLVKGPPFNLRGGQGFGDGPKIFFFLWSCRHFFFTAAWSSNYLFHFYFGMDLFFEGNYLFQHLAATNYYHLYYFIYYHFTIFLL